VRSLNRSAIISHQKLKINPFLIFFCFFKKVFLPPHNPRPPLRYCVFPRFCYNSYIHRKNKELI